MKLQRVALALTTANVVLLILILTKVLPSPARAVDPSFAQAAPSSAQRVVPILRGRVLELVDGRDQVRSRINVEPDGEVVLRLLDQNGTIRVKLGAGENGSGLLLLDEAAEPGVHIVARRAGTAAKPATTSVTLRSGDGQKRVIRP